MKLWLLRKVVKSYSYRLVVLNGYQTHSTRQQTYIKKQGNFDRGVSFSYVYFKIEISILYQMALFC